MNKLIFYTSLLCFSLYSIDGIAGPHDFEGSGVCGGDCRMVAIRGVPEFSALTGEMEETNVYDLQCNKCGFTQEGVEDHRSSCPGPAENTCRNCGLTVLTEGTHMYSAECSGEHK